MVHGGAVFAPSEYSKDYFTKKDPQYLFTVNLVKALSAPIEKDFDYTKRQGLKRNTVYPKEMWYWQGMPIECEEFMTTKCKMTGDCYFTDLKTGKKHSSLEGTGIVKAEPGQCDDRSRMERMKDKVMDMMVELKDGKLVMMDSAAVLASSTLAAISISMTIF